MTTQQMNDSIEVKLELGHKAILKKGYNPEGYTHDWKLFVRGPEGCNIQHFIEKVVFVLHSTFPRPKRVIKEPPYEVSECGYASFNVPIEIYFKNKNEPKKLQFMYDLFLRMDEQVNHIRCEKLTFQNPHDDFKKRLLLSGGTTKSFSPESAKDGNSKKSPVQATQQQTIVSTPKSAPLVANTPDSRAFVELFGPPDVAKKSKKRNSDRERSSTPKSTKESREPPKLESSSHLPKPDVSPAPGSGNHSNRIIDLTSEKSNHSSTSSSSSKHKQSEKSRSSSSSHKEAKYRHSSEGRSSSKTPGDKPSESQDRLLHPSSAERKTSHERRSGSHDKQHSSSHDSKTESSEKRSKSQDKSLSSNDRRSGSYEKHSQSSSHDKKVSSHDRHSKTGEARSSASQEKEKHRSSSEKSVNVHERQSGSHDHKSQERERIMSGNKSSDHSAHGVSERMDKSSRNSSTSKSSFKRSAEDSALPKDDHSMSKKKKKRDKEKDKDYIKELKPSKEVSEKKDNKVVDGARDGGEKKSSKGAKSEKEVYRAEKERAQENRGEKMDRQKEKVDREKEISDREKSEDVRGDKSQSQKYQRHKSVEKKTEKKEEKQEKKEERGDWTGQEKQQSGAVSRKGSEYRKGSKEGTSASTSGKDRKKSNKSKEEMRDSATASAVVAAGGGGVVVKEEDVVLKRAEKEHKVNEKVDKKTGKKRKKGHEDLDSVASSNSDVSSFVDEDSVGKKKKKKHSHKSKSYSSSRVKKKSISEIYTDSEEEGEIKDDSFNSGRGTRNEGAAVGSRSPVAKPKGKKRSPTSELVGKENKTRKDVIKDLFSSSDEDSPQVEEPEIEEEEEMDIKEEPEVMESDVEEDQGGSISGSQSDSEDDPKLSDVESEEELRTKTTDKGKTNSTKKLEKPAKSSDKPVKDSKSLFRDDIFSTGELSDDDPFGDNLDDKHHDSKVEASFSFKENTKPLDKLLSEIDSESSLDDEDILSPMEHTAPFFSPRKPPSVSNKSPRSKQESSHHLPPPSSHKSPKPESSQSQQHPLSSMHKSPKPGSHSQQHPPPSSSHKSPKSGSQSQQRENKVDKSQPTAPISSRSSVHVSPLGEKHRSPAARGGKGPNNVHSIKHLSNREEEPAVDVQNETTLRGSRREKGSIIANKSPKVPSDVIRSDLEDEEGEQEEVEESNSDDDESVSSGSSSSSAESGENSESEDSENGQEEEEEEVDAERKDSVKQKEQKQIQKQAAKGKGDGVLNLLIENESKKSLQQQQMMTSGLFTGLPREKDIIKERSTAAGGQRLDGDGFSGELGPGGDNNLIRRSDTGIFDGFLCDNLEAQQDGEHVEKKGRSFGSKKKGSPASGGGGASNVARVEPLVRDKPKITQAKERGKDVGKKGFVVLPNMAGGDNKGMGSGSSASVLETKQGGATEATIKGTTSGVVAGGVDVYTRKAPNGEYLGSLLDLQKKLYSIMSNRELLNSIVKIIMKDDTFYSISDTTFDFDLCRLDKNTLNKIEGFLQTTN